MNNTKTFETERLILRKFELSDAEIYSIIKGEEK